MLLLYFVMSINVDWLTLAGDIGDNVRRSWAVILSHFDFTTINRPMPRSRGNGKVTEIVGLRPRVCTRFYPNVTTLRSAYGMSRPSSVVCPSSFGDVVASWARNYLVDIYTCAKFHCNSCTGSLPPNMWNITLLWLFYCPVLSWLYFFSRNCAQVEPLDGF